MALFLHLLRLDSGTVLNEKKKETKKTSIATEV